MFSVKIKPCTKKLTHKNDLMYIKNHIKLTHNGNQVL